MARTVVDLREDLFEKARRITGLRRKVDVVNEALRRLVEQAEVNGSIRRLRGKVQFRVTGPELLAERHRARR